MMHELPPALATRRPGVAPFVDAAVRRALAKRPDDRFPNAAAFAAALLPVPPDGVEPAAVAPASEPRVTSRGRTVSARAALYAAFATLVLGLAGGRLMHPRSLIQRWIDAAPAAVRPAADRPRAAAVEPLATAGNGSLTVVDRAGRPLREPTRR